MASRATHAAATVPIRLNTNMTQLLPMLLGSDKARSLLLLTAAPSDALFTLHEFVGQFIKQIGGGWWPSTCVCTMAQ